MNPLLLHILLQAQRQRRNIKAEARRARRAAGAEDSEGSEESEEGEGGAEQEEQEQEQVQEQQSAGVAHPWPIRRRQMTMRVST